ncbi:nucleotide-binding universal stress UspA family protein [Rhodoligotrophos appendicifer]|uniref:universal stress protein n=1 Tax=Rhodoligotrophos appendicifer TaxID=987056 RepID=UPI00118542C4|nr:universal stress protein [Rhodoligotrophos appendicifer]
MGYKTIVVSLNDVERAGTVLGVATNVAARFDAHVIGVYVIPAVQVYPAIAMQITPEIMDSQRQYYEDRATEVKALFEQATSSKGLSHEWRQVDALGSLIADEVIALGRNADLIVAGQVDPDSDSLVEVDLCERILMETGRPLLAVPSAGHFEELGTHVTVAWAHSRESTRALFDALPLLKGAKQTVVLRVNPDEDESTSGSEITTTLGRHGVTAEYHRSVAKHISVGDEILSRISDYGSDLVVMGGYGHSRMRELFFGGATRDILQHMTVPVLISH